MDALTVFCLYVEKVETSLHYYTLLNHTCTVYYTLDLWSSRHAVE